MTAPTGPHLHRIASPSGLAACFNANGSLRELRWGDDLCVHLFPGNALEAGSTQVVLRRWPGTQPEGEPQHVALLGPDSPARWHAEDDRLVARGEWQGLAFELTFVLAANEPAWFWHLAVHHLHGSEPCTIDAICQHDIGLAPHAALRLNEYYVSHYLDFTPLDHPARGRLLAVRQNLPVAGRHPWALLGSLRHASAYATDAMQVLGTAHRWGAAPVGWRHGLPDDRLQQEHAMAALQDTPLSLAPGERATLGFFGGLQAHHPQASGTSDAEWADRLLALPEAQPPQALPAAVLQAVWQPPRPSLFTQAPRVVAEPLIEAELDAVFGARRLLEEHGPDGALWSFFTPDGEHVVLPAKEHAVQRPHGHLLRSGEHLVPDESSMTSTCWMAGVFHSMVTQGHVSINRLLSTVHGALGQYRSQGQRIFVRLGGRWQLLAQPSAFAMGERRARWWYRTGDSLIEVVAAAAADAPELTLDLRFIDGSPVECLVTHHVALAGDDGEVPGRCEVHHRPDGSLWLAPPEGSALHQRFPTGGFSISPQDADTRVLEVAGDELLFDDGEDHGVPMLCLHLAASPSLGLRLRGELVEPAHSVGPTLATLQPPSLSSPGGEAQALSAVLPWFQHNALVHYLSPRGLEQYSGGGWGTRDVCQGPAELLLAQSSLVPLRDLLRRVFSAQNPDGDWPQWFMFFERERAIRADDSHGDIVLWPLLALGDYLRASGDDSLLSEHLPFHSASAIPADEAPTATLWQHVERALALIAQRRIAGTSLMAYGHGDWNDSLQPADPRLREHLCSTWTVTLQAQVLSTLAEALALLGHTERAETLHQQRLQVQADLRRWLMPAESIAPDAAPVLAGYVLFEPTETAEPQPLLHPNDRRTGVHYSLLPMVHAVLADLLSADEAEAHFALIEQHLLGPDGARLFDVPLPYRGGPQQLFQRAESSSYFGREIGLMYTHAHLRYAEALAHLGRAEAFWQALNLAHPVDLRRRLPCAAPRQANCYYSSSDAAFADRYEAADHYERAMAGEVAFEGGWRVYSSGAGIALALVQRSLLGLRPRSDGCLIDPVIAPSLGALQAQTLLAGRRVTIDYQLGPRGHGVREVLLNGTPLALAAEAQAYREGGVRVAWAEMAPCWRAEGNRLQVRTG
ncbi:hypothetical protein AACH06_15750 [Ideonella sp. DXS29W]|uniref:Cellobiose phosphorylase n=1 Tax=Ideonella lacteola TaxID=2984193 RepID=A0ABU9BS58_9BURK